MVLIPAGSFEMGDHFSEGDEDELPVHTVTLDAFYMDTHEVTVGQFKQFNNQMKGYLTNEAVVHAPESRTSSPIRIPRDRNTYQHPQIKGLYPCGEGAGYAGGIISAAIDGEKCAEHC